MSDVGFRWVGLERGSEEIFDLGSAWSIGLHSSALLYDRFAYGWTPLLGWVYV